MDEAPNEKERDIRGRKKMKLLKNVMHLKRLDLASDSEKPEENAATEPLRMMPGLKIRPEDLESGHLSVNHIKAEDLQLLLEKIVRGVMYLQYELYIEEDQRIIQQIDRTEGFPWDKLGMTALTSLRIALILFKNPQIWAISSYSYCQLLIKQDYRPICHLTQ